MCQIMNGVAKAETAYSLKVQSGYNESDREWHGKGKRAYSLKMQSRCDGSDRD